MNNPLFGQYHYIDFTHESGFTPNSVDQCLSAIGFRNIEVYYEKIPYSRKEKHSIRRRMKKKFQKLKLKIISSFLGINPEVFCENITVIARP